MGTSLLLELLLKSKKFLFFNLAFFIVLLFSTDANLSLIQIQNDYHDRSAFNLILNEQSSLLLLGIGLFGLAGTSRKKRKKNNKL
jgi:LPXTG-motif cell wall-anchored protein